ncbi:MAG: TrkA C-terminal domain-containing protein [Candidatus Hadarchaeales archaeon]
MNGPNYQPKSVRELLREMKDTSDLLVDLSFAAIFFENRELAEVVQRLETKMDDLMYTIRIMAAVAARNVNEAKKITGILQVASATEKISNATGDIADIVIRGIKVHPVVREAIRLADEKVVMVRVKRHSQLAGKTFRELRLPSTIGVWTLGLKREGKWIIPLTGDTEILARDILLSRGPRDGVQIFVKMAGEEIKRPQVETKLSKIRLALAEIRDLIGIMVDMAYSSILFGSREIAEEVRRFEKKFDSLNYHVWLETLRAAKTEADLRSLSGVLQIAKCAEKISDAAEMITDVVLRGAEIHPVFARALSESEEQMRKVIIPINSPFIGRKLRDLKLWETTGAYVFMIERGRRCIVDPPRSIKIKAGDALFIRGSAVGVKKVLEMAGASG